MIKIDAKRPLAPVTIANSDGVQVGDWAVAIGSPFGLEASVTAGIVSATDRTSVGQQFQRFIQTDAAINPGNSGGPLLNIKGEVIGVNTMIATQSGGSQGIGFALPINTVVRVYNDIIRDGRVTRGSIGISWAPGTKTGDAARLGRGSRRDRRRSEKGRPGGQGRHQSGRHHPGDQRPAGQERRRTGRARRGHAGGHADQPHRRSRRQEDGNQADHSGSRQSVFRRSRAWWAKMPSRANGSRQGRIHPGQIRHQHSRR